MAILFVSIRSCGYCTNSPQRTKFSFRAFASRQREFEMRRISSHISWSVWRTEAEGIKQSFVRTKRDQEMTFAYARQHKTKYNNTHAA